MNQIAVNTFSEGLITDLSPLSTPNTVLTDCINGTLITYNGNEFTLQNDLGNVRMNNISLPKGYVPVGMKEYGGIVYVASYNPQSGDCQIGSFPGPQTLDFGENMMSDYKSIDKSDIINSSTHQATAILRPLFDMTDKINPGDKYQIRILKSDDNFLIDQSSSNRIIKIKYFYQTEDGKVIQVEPSDITTVPDKDPIYPEKFGYFKGSSGSIIMVSYEIEKPDYFNINITAPSENSLNIQAIAKNKKLPGLFKGFKLDVKQDGITTTDYYENKKRDTKIEGVSITGINTTNTGTNVDLTLTPYSDYCYFDDLKLNRTYTPQEIQQLSSSINSVFKYYVEDTGLKIDFDFNYNKQNLDLFVELYDPCSDCSTVKKVDDPTQYGINTVLFDLVDEPIVKLNDSITRGGVLYSELTGQDVSIYNLEQYHAMIPTPVSTVVVQGEPAKNIIYVRNNSNIRKNHFYIVKITMVETSIVDGLTTYVYNHFIKSLYTNNKFNQYYNIIDDFETIKINVNDFISFNYKINSDSITFNDNTSADYDDETRTLMTDGETYKVDEAELVGSYFYWNKFNQNRTIDFDITYDASGIFGDFNQNILSTSDANDVTVTTEATQDFEAIKKIDYIDSDPKYLGSSTNTVSKTKTSGTRNYKLVFDYNTYRNTSAAKIKEIKKIEQYKSYPIKSTLFTRDDFQNNPIKVVVGGDLQQTIEPHSVAGIHIRTQFYTAPFRISEYDMFDDNLGTLMNSFRANFRNNISAFICNIPNDQYWALGTFQENLSDGEKYLQKTPYANAPWRHLCLVLDRQNQRENGFSRIHNYEDIIELFTNVSVCSKSTIQPNLYYPDMSSFKNISSGTTTYKQSVSLNASITNITDPLFSFWSVKQKEGAHTFNFNSTDLLSFLTNLSSGSITKITSTLGSNPSLYPKLTSSVERIISIPISDYVVTKGSDPVKDGTTINLSSKWANGQLLVQNLISTTAPTVHGGLFKTTSNALKLDGLINNLTVTDFNGNPFDSFSTITEDNFRLLYTPRVDKNHRGKWKRRWDTSDKLDAPNIIDDYVYQ